MACSLATFVLLIPGNLAPLMTVDLLGAERSSVLASGIATMWKGGWVLLALLLGMFGIVLPFVRFGALAIVLGAVRMGRCFKHIGALFRWVLWLDIWAMPDVYLLGCFVGYSRVTQNLSGRIGAGGYCFIAAALLSMLTRAALDRRTVWRAIAPDRKWPRGQAVLSCTVCDLVEPASREGEPCSRCGRKLHSRKPDAIVRAAALSIAALALTLPANLFPMTYSTQLGQDVPHRIADGVSELFQAGLWPLGILIVCTSIVIPVAKIVGMGWFIVSIKRRSRKYLRLKAHMFRLIDELGRWSNVDVFTIAAFIPLIRFGGVASSRPAAGASAFALVVFFTMAASRAFDPRMMWDARDRSTG